MIVVAALLLLTLLPVGNALAAAVVEMGALQPMAETNIAKVDFNNSIYADSVEYDATAHAGMGSLAFWDDTTGVAAYDLPQAETYIGTTRAGDVYNSATPPTQAGDYTCTIVSDLAADSLYSFPTSGNAYVGTLPTGCTVTVDSSSKLTLKFDFVITPRWVTIIADDKNMVAGENRPVFTYTLDGLAPGETEADALRKKPTLGCVANTKMTGKYPITVEDYEYPAVNYNIRAQNGTLTVTAPFFSQALVPQGMHIFPTAQLGYDPLAPLTATFTNIGAGELNGVSVSVMGSHAACFELGGTTSLGTMKRYDVMNFTVVPIQELAEGTYTARVYVNASPEVSSYFDVSFKVGTSTIYDSDTTSIVYNGDGQPRTLRVDADIKKYQNTTVGGKVTSAVTETPGSTVITFPAAYLNTLANGTYAVRVNFVDGYAQVTLKVMVEEEKQAPTSPKTGDESNLSLYIAPCMMAAVVIWGVIKFRNRKVSN